MQQELFKAVYEQNLEYVNALLETGIDPNIANTNGNTPLHLAALNCHRSDFYLELAEYLLLYGASANVTNNNEETPLFLAVYRDHLGLASLLLEHLANPNIMTKGGYVALQLAKGEQMKDLLKINGAVLKVKHSKPSLATEHSRSSKDKKRSVFDISTYINQFFPTTREFEEKYLASAMNVARNKLEYLELMRQGNRESKDWSAYVLQRHFSSNIDLIRTSVSQPYFGRIDVERDGVKESLYIGQNGLDSDSRVWVVNWTTPIAKLFYRKTLGKGTDPELGEFDLNIIRNIDNRNGVIFDIHTQTSNAGYVDPLLERVLSSKKAIASMDNIVSTIQAEQDHIIRLPKNVPLIVQGSAGSGKTTIALHRLAYLFYNHPDIEAENMIIFGPNKLFIKYIENVLPGLGVNGIQQNSFEVWALEVLRSKEPDLSLTAVSNMLDMSEDSLVREQHKRNHWMKGSLAWKASLQHFLEACVKRINLPEKIEIKINEELHYEFADIHGKFFHEYSYLPLVRKGERLLQVIKKDYEDYLRRQLDDFEEEKRRFSQKFWAIYTFIKDQTSKFSIVQLYRDFLKAREEAAPIRGVYSEDLPALVHIYHFLYGHVSHSESEKRYKYLVIDEAQDWNPFQLSVVYQHLCIDHSIMLLGDLGQGIFEEKGISRWSEISEVFEKRAEYIELTTSYRSTIQITTLANRLIQSYSRDKGFSLSQPVLREGKEPTVQEFDTNRNILYAIERTIQECRINGLHQIAILTRTTEQAQVVFKNLNESDMRLIEDTESIYLGGTVVMPVSLSKGLEFDVVIICNASDYNYPNHEQNRKLLYVASTRALHELYVYYKGAPSPILSEVESSLRPKV